ncbi:MAG: ATP-binding protein, partial [Propionicimonas sp.]
MFVGRSADLAQVDELLAEAAAGNAGVLWLTGDPGVGKSALVDVATRRARRRGLQTALVRAVPFGGATTAALIDDLRRAVGGPSADLGARRPDRGTGTASLVDALVDELVGWARGAPSLVTIDDLTSADEDSVAAVVGAVSRSMGLPLAVLLTGPDAVLPASTSDGASAALARWPQRRLGPLDTLAAAAVARSALGPGASERTVAA